MFTKWLLQTEECFIAIPNTVELNYVETQETVVTESDFDRSKYFENVFTDDKRLMSTQIYNKKERNILEVLRKGWKGKFKEF